MAGGNLKGYLCFRFLEWVEWFDLFLLRKNKGEEEGRKRALISHNGSDHWLWGEREGRRAHTHAFGFWVGRSAKCFRWERWYGQWTMRKGREAGQWRDEQEKREFKVLSDKDIFIFSWLQLIDNNYKIREVQVGNTISARGVYVLTLSKSLYLWAVRSIVSDRRCYGWPLLYHCSTILSTLVIFCFVLYCFNSCFASFFLVILYFYSIAKVVLRTRKQQQNIF